VCWPVRGDYGMIAEQLLLLVLLLPGVCAAALLDSCKQGACVGDPLILLLSRAPFPALCVWQWRRADLHCAVQWLAWFLGALAC
jgi:hypothetical protein